MASNPTSSFGIEFGDVDDFQVGVSRARRRRYQSVARLPALRRTRRSPRGTVRSLPPFAALAARQGRPLRVAILSDFTRISYANGAVFQTRFLYQELRRCGHEVTVIGPHDPDATPEELAPGTVALPSVPLKTYPGLHLPMPLAPWIFDPDRWNFDIVFAQTTSLLLEFGVWLRKMKGIPLLCVNTTHLVAAYDVLLPEKLSKNELLQAGRADDAHAAVREALLAHLQPERRARRPQRGPAGLLARAGRDRAHPRHPARRCSRRSSTGRSAPTRTRTSSSARVCPSAGRASSAPAATRARSRRIASSASSRSTSCRTSRTRR